MTVEIRDATGQPLPPPALEQHLRHFQHRLLADALQEATSHYWNHRADQFAAVGTPAADNIALACRRHAQLLTDLGLDTDAHQLINLTLIDPGEAA